MGGFISSMMGADDTPSAGDNTGTGTNGNNNTGTGTNGNNNNNNNNNNNEEETVCSKNWVKKSDYVSFCHKNHYYLESEVLNSSTLDQIYDKVMSILNAFTVEADDKKKLIELISNYDAFVKKTGDSVEIIVNNLIVDAMDYPEETFYTTFEGMNDICHFKSNSIAENKACVKDTSTPDVTYISNIKSCIRATYIFIATAVIYDFFMDCAKDPNYNLISTDANYDASKVMKYKKHITDENGTNNNVINNANIKKTFIEILGILKEKLWGRLAMTFWIQRLIDVTASSQKDEDSNKLKSALLSFLVDDDPKNKFKASVLKSVPEPFNSISKDVTNEYLLGVFDKSNITNLDLWCLFMVLHDYVAYNNDTDVKNGNKQKTFTDNIGAFSICAAHTWLEMKDMDFTKLQLSTKDMFNNSKGFLFDTSLFSTDYKATVQGSLGFSPDYMQSEIEKIERYKFHFDNSEKTLVLKPSTTSKFIPLGLDACQRQRSKINPTLVIVIIILIIVGAYVTAKLLYELRQKHVQKQNYAQPQ